MAHLKALTKELEMSMAKVAITSKGRAFIWKLQGIIDAILHPPVRNKQRVDTPDSNPPGTCSHIGSADHKNIKCASHNAHTRPHDKSAVD
jgi:hypothetical protein